MKILLKLILVFFALNVVAQDEEYLIKELKYHKGAVNAIDFSRSGKMLATAGEDKTLQIIDLASGFTLVHKHEDIYFPVKDMCFFGDNQLFVTAGTDIKLIDLFNNTQALYKGNSTQFWSVDFAPERNKITGGSYDEKIKVWDVATKKMELILEGHDKSALAASFSPDEKYIVTGSRDQTVKVWNAKTGELIKNLERHSDNIYDIEFHPNPKYFVSASKDKTVRMWDIETGNVVKTYTGNDATILDVEFSPEGYFMYTASYDGIVMIYEVATGKKLYSFILHEGAVNKIRADATGSFVATCGADGKVMVWESAKWIAVKTYYGEELNNIIDSKSVFGERKKGESKQDYADRKAEAAVEKAKIVNELFEKYKQQINFSNIPK